MSQNIEDFWRVENLTLQNIPNYMKYLKENYPEYASDFTVMEKKLIKGNKTTLSQLITFTRTINKEKQPELDQLIRKLVQFIMDNPKKFRK